MAQQPPTPSVREEDRVLPIAFERAVGMVPKLLAAAAGGEVETLGDGYYFVKIGVGRSGGREITVRLGRQGPDTRVAVRVESVARPWVMLGIIAFAIFTAGLGMLPLIPWFNAATRREARERDLAVHKVFRAIEDAVAEQGASPNYRIAPGADAAEREDEVDGEQAGVEAARAG